MSTTVNTQVAASTDDAFEGSTGTMSLAASTIGAITTGNQWAGFRMQLNVPQGKVIDSATFQMYSVGTTNDTLVADLYGQAADDATTFTNSSGNISGRARTTAKTSVNAVDVGVGWYSVDLTSVIQKIVNRPGWVANNYVVIILDGLTGIAWNCRAYDGTPSEAAKLSVTYSDPGGAGQPTIARARQVPGMRRPHLRQGW